MEKIRVLVGNHYQLHGHSNGAKYLKSFRTGWTFLDPNPDEVYDMITRILQLILLIISSCKLADLLRSWLFLQSNPASSLEQTVTTLGRKLTFAIFPFFFVEKW